MEKETEVTMETVKKMQPYTKAFVAFVVGMLQILSLFVTLNADGRLSPEDINAIIAAMIIALGGTGAVYQLPNKEAK